MYSTDEKYTNGILYEWGEQYEPCVSLRDSGDKVFVAADKVLALSDDTVIHIHSHVNSIGMNMYTPTDISSTVLQDEDRPYAGLFYFGFRNNEMTLARKQYEQTISHAFKFGCMGPCAMQEEVQTKWHEAVRWAFHSDKPVKPMGWDHQIDDELMFLYTYDNQKTFYADNGFDDSPSGAQARRFDATRIYTVNLGNIFDTAEAGLQLRYGRIGNILSAGAKPGNIIKRKNQKGKSYIDDRDLAPPPPHYDRFAFARARVRAVLYNATLEGGLVDRLSDGEIESVHTVDALPYTVDFELGYSHEYKNGLVLEISAATRSTEFDEPDWSLFEHYWTQLKLSKAIDL